MVDEIQNPKLQNLNSSNSNGKKLCFIQILNFLQGHFIKHNPLISEEWTLNANDDTSIFFQIQTKMFLF